MARLPALFSPEIKLGVSHVSEKQVTPEVLDELVNFLADFVIKPADKEQAKELLWDATEAQLIELINSINGSNENVPLAK